MSGERDSIGTEEKLSLKAILESVLRTLKAKPAPWRNESPPDDQRQLILSSTVKHLLFELDFTARKP